MRIHHVQLMIPRGEEGRALDFYEALLGLTRIPKPDDMPNPDGVWFSLGDSEFHLGVQDQAPAPTRAHVAFAVDALDEVLARLEASSVRVERSNPVAGMRRAHVWDPFGNRLELMGV